MDDNRKPLFVNAREIQEDWGVSKAMAYNIIRRMSEQLKKENPKSLILQGKINRAFYEECCGIRKAQYCVMLL